MEIAQSEIERYQVAWSDYIRRRRLLLGLAVGYIPWGVAVVLAMRLGLSETAAYVLIIAWFAMFPAASIRLLLWRCPQCRGYFSFPGWYAKYFSRTCVRCGISKKEIQAVFEGLNGQFQ